MFEEGGCSDEDSLSLRRWNEVGREGGEVEQIRRLIEEADKA